MVIVFYPNIKFKLYKFNFKVNIISFNIINFRFIKLINKCKVLVRIRNFMVWNYLTRVKFIKIIITKVIIFIKSIIINKYVLILFIEVTY
jgi:hypothetical protein